MSLKLLTKLINNKKCIVGVVGLGYVGLPLIKTFCESGFTCVGFDIDKNKIEKLNAGKSYIKHIKPEIIKQLIDSRSFFATDDETELSKCNAIIICVPTPLNNTRDPDMTYIINTSEMISRNLKVGQLVVLESTTYPGTTKDVVQPILEKTGLKADKDFYLAFSPEREDPGRDNFNTRTIPKVVGGIGCNSSMVACLLYGSAIDKVVPVSNTDIAESVKILENVYRCVNIALINEMKMLFDKMGIDIWEVISAASTKPFGFQPFYPGPGLGGHCIPIDPFYLSWKARSVDTTTKFIELAGEINTSMPEYVISNTIKALNAKRKSVKNAKILILGLAYKKNVDDCRESPSLKIIEMLQGLGAKVDYNDPYIPSAPKMRKHNLGMKSKQLSSDMISKYDCVIILTDHDSYDYEMIVKKSKIIIDTRNATRNVKNRNFKNTILF